MKKSIIITGSAVLFSVIFMFTIYLLGSCTKNSSSTGLKQSGQIVTTDNGAIDISDVPDDGRAHIIYRSEWQVIKCKIIHISNSYTTHVVWVETSCERCTGNGEIKTISSH